MNFVIRRIAFYLVAFLVAATVNFALPRLMPGNPIDVMFAQQNSTLTPEARDALIATFGCLGPAAPAVSRLYEVGLYR